MYTKMNISPSRLFTKLHGILADTVANVIAALLTYQLPTVLLQVSDPVSRYFNE